MDEGLSTCGEKALDVEKMMLQSSTSIANVEKLQHEVRQTKWGHMMKSMHFSAALNSMRLDAHAAQDEAKRRERELLVELETLSVKLRASEEEKLASRDRSKKSMKSLEEMKSFSEMERKAMHDRHSALLDDIQKKHSRERMSMQAQLEAAVQTAVATAGQKFKAATAEKVARLEKPTASAEARLADSSKRNKELTRQGEAEIARVLQEFSKYKSLKEKEVGRLEEKIGKAVEAKARSKIYGGRGSRKPASAKEPAPWESEGGEEYRAHASIAITTIQDALGSDKVAARQREVAMAQRKLKLAEKAMEELKQKLQKSRTKVEYLQGRLTAAERARESDTRPSTDAYESLRTQLKAAKEAAKAANYESARRLREIKVLKGSDSASREDSKRAAAEQAEARAAAEQKLQQATYAIDHKDVLIRDMKGKLASLESADIGRLRAAVEERGQDKETAACDQPQGRRHPGVQAAHPPPHRVGRRSGCGRGGCTVRRPGPDPARGPLEEERRDEAPPGAGLALRGRHEPGPGLCRAGREARERGLAPGRGGSTRNALPYALAA